MGLNLISAAKVSNKWSAGDMDLEVPVCATLFGNLLFLNEVVLYLDRVA